MKLGMLGSCDTWVVVILGIVVTLWILGIAVILWILGVVILGILVGGGSNTRDFEG